MSEFQFNPECKCPICLGVSMGSPSLGMRLGWPNKHKAPALVAPVLRATDRINHCELHSFDADWKIIRAHLDSQEAEIARLHKENGQLRNYHYIYGDDGNGSSCYSCGGANPHLHGGESK
jgi:hypothetical protein